MSNDHLLDFLRATPRVRLAGGARPAMLALVAASLAFSAAAQGGVIAADWHAAGDGL